MSAQNWQLGRRVLAVLLTIVSSASLAEASHFRYGHLTWRARPDISPSTVEFALTNAFRRCGYSGSGSDGCPIIGDVISEEIGGTQLFPGDGAALGSPLQYRVTAFDPVDDWVIGVALDPSTGADRIIHTYAAPDNGGSPWVASIDSCCRIGGLANNASSYRVGTLVDLSILSGSPVSSLPPIVACPQNAVCNFLVPGADADPDSVLLWRLSTPSEDGGIQQPGPPIVANALSIDPANGSATWDTTGAAAGSLWATQALVEARDPSTGALKTSVAIDYIIRIVVSGDPPIIVPPPNTPPICGTTVPTFVGDMVSFVISASDANSGDLVTLNTAGLPPGAGMDPSLPTSGNPVSSTFSWTPAESDVGSHVINFFATDGGGLQTLCPVTVEVAAEPTCVPTSVAGSSQPNIRVEEDAAGRARTLGAQLAQAERFVRTEKNRREKLDVKKARAAGISADAIDLALQVIALDNLIIAAVQRGQTPDLARTEFSFIEPLFMAMAAGDVCGTRQEPSNCPSRIDSEQFFESDSAAKSHLEGEGYHQTPRYASQAGYGIDYAKVAPNACGSGVFRDQAVLRRSGECWTYFTQGPEPNPEILSYVWPYFRWPSYVWWWHRVFC